MATQVYAVTGNPIAHSLSPQIHSLFAAQTGQDLRYEARLGDPERFSEQVRGWFRDGLAGLNITVPFKTDAYTLPEHLTERAQQARAINTLWSHPDGSLHGDNTDGAGFMADLRRLEFSVQQRRVLILGAGGAVRGILAPLLAANPELLVIANRSQDRARELLQDAPYSESTLMTCPLDSIPVKEYDLIIQATAAGLHSVGLYLPSLRFTTHSLAYDLAYGPAALGFLDWAREQGAQQLSDGLGMLVEQAAEAFWLWRGVRPETLPVLQTLAKTLHP